MLKLISLIVLTQLVGVLPQDPVVEPKQPLFAVVVHVEQEVAQTGNALKATIKQLFLKDLSCWPDGTKARPYSREGSSKEHKTFARVVLGMDDAELARHWLKQKNLSGTTPPRSVGSDRMILKHVASRKGAFAVVAVDAVRGVEGVRVLLEF